MLVDHWRLVVVHVGVHLTRLLVLLLVLDVVLRLLLLLAGYMTVSWLLGVYIVLGYVSLLAWDCVLLAVCSCGLRVNARVWNRGAIRLVSRILSYDVILDCVLDRDIYRRVVLLLLLCSGITAQ